MDKSDIKAQEMTMNVRREIAIMKALKHRNIVNLRQVLTSQSKLYIVMDLVTGGELFTKILKEGKLEESVARRYFQQLVDGIEYCHRRGVCHRDLKPENLLIDETTGELKITDFGLSAMRGASTTEELLHTQCGSPNYCAPEIIARHKQGYNGNKVDAWSCGIILFALLAGFLPFYDENTKVLYRMIQRDEVKFPKKFPPDAKDLVLRLLHKEPEKRYTLAEVKKHPWFAVDYEGDDAVPKSTGSGASPPASRRKRRGHSRKSSVDQAPRSRDMVTRKRSDKAERDNIGQGGATVPSVASPPLAYAMPTPPAVTDVNIPRTVPGAHRPPAPPTVSVPQPRSLPTVRQLPPATPPALVPPSAQQPPLPPPPTYAVAAAARSMPPCLVPGTTQRVSRDYRASYPNDQVSVSGGEPTHYGIVNNVGVGNSAAPYYPPEIALQQPLPPPFPAPEVHAESMGAYSPSALQLNCRHGQIPNGVPPPPQVPPHRITKVGVSNADALLFKPPVMSSGEADHQAGTAGEVSARSGSTVPTASEADIETTTQNGQSLDDGVSSVSSLPSKVSRPKWKVSGPPPPPSYAQSTVAPVTTPPSFASGDDSWMKFSKNRSEEKAESNRAVKFDTTSTEDGKAPKESLDTSPKPSSLVAQRRLLFNKAATESDVGPPLPDSSLSSSFVTERSASSRAEPKSVPLIHFGDRMETPGKLRYPTANDGGVECHPSSPHTSKADWPPQESGNEDSSNLRPVSEEKSDSVSVHGESRETVQSVPNSSGNDDCLGEHGETVEDETQIEHEGDTSMIHSSAKDGTTLPCDGADAVPIKQRLAAALARYRRIFKLGNNIGITSSPSFSSNKGEGLNEERGENDNKPASNRAEFFARAKAITGAWGIILTQELEEDSDSDDEAFQVTETELQAFSRLLDFWDNRRNSATVSNGGEVILDDEKTSPLSEEDILCIQSLLQKLEPKQVEEEMKEVSEAEDDASQDTSNYLQKTAPGLTGVIADVNDEGTGNSHADELVGHSVQRSGRSDASSETQSPGACSVQTGRPVPVIAKSSPDKKDRTAATSAPPLPPPPYAAPIPPPVDTDRRRMVVTPSTVRDPFRPKPSPSYPPPQSLGNGSTSLVNDDNDAQSNVVVETAAAIQVGARIPQGLSRETELNIAAKRKSSMTASDAEAEARKTLSQDSGGRFNSVASAVSDGSGSGAGNKSGHFRSPSRDEHATRGMFSRGMFSRRKSTPMTSFSSDLPADTCVTEIARILVGMNCVVLMKREETKMKCEVPVKQEKLLVSIICVQDRRGSTIQFKRGRKDRSHVDSREFFAFFQDVQSRFLDRAAPEARSR